MSAVLDAMAAAGIKKESASEGAAATVLQRKIRARGEEPSMSAAVDESEPAAIRSSCDGGGSGGGGGLRCRAGD